MFQRIRITLKSVHLAGLILAFGTDDMFDVGQFKQIAKFGTVENVRGMDHGLHTVCCFDRYGAHLDRRLLRLQSVDG